MAIRIGTLSDSSLVARKLGEVHVRIAASPVYLEQFGTPQHWREMDQHQCIIDTNFRDPWHWPFASGDGSNEIVTVPVRGRLRFANTEACLQAAIAGLGLARLPGFIAAPALQRGEIVRLLENVETPPLGLFAVYPPARHLAHRARLLIDFMVTHFTHFPPA